jgi:ketosteroid isomerase-like protein
VPPRVTRCKLQMKTRSLLAIFAALAVALSIVPASAQPPDIAKEIENLEDKVNAAYAANDLPTYFSYYASDFTQWLPDGRTDLPQYVKMWTDNIKQGGKIEADQLSDLHIQVSPSGDTAVASYLLHVRERSPKGEVSDGDYHESDVWFKRDGVWKIVHLHYSPAPKKKNP